MNAKCIINLEYFLQCHGDCKGCFLKDFERQEKNTHAKEVQDNLYNLLNHNLHYNNFIVGFGRGNILNLENYQLQELDNMIEQCEKILKGKHVIYEVSTSLIGKIDRQIEKALYLIRKNHNIYFNVVINSEITSESFWKNWNYFYETLEKERIQWGLKDNLGDILVLNINPKKLPDLEKLKKYIGNKQSPINIAFFPFSDEKIESKDLFMMNDWSKKIFELFRKQDLNIKNYLELLHSINIENNLEDILNYHKNTEKSYWFIDKNGQLQNGSFSIMGEIDYFRLLEKYQIKPSFIEAIKIMQKEKHCSKCEYQKECLLSGAYLNMMINHQKIQNNDCCLNGYQPIFQTYHS
jgi:hypothetical protein